MTKQLLQIAVAVGGVVPIAAGLMGVALGPAMIGDSAVPVSLDSHYRYLSGLLLGIGFGFWSTIADIEKHKARFQLLTLIVVIGGLARFYSLIVAGVPNTGMVFGLAMELVVVPMLALWQSRVASCWKADSSL